MFNFDKCLTINAITFGLTEIERNESYLVDMKLCCASNVAIKNVKIARKKTTFFSKYFQQNGHFSKEYRFLGKNKIYHLILEVLPIISTTYLPV